MVTREMKIDHEEEVVEILQEYLSNNPHVKREDISEHDPLPEDDFVRSYIEREKVKIHAATAEARNKLAQLKYSKYASLNLD